MVTPVSTTAKSIYLLRRMVAASATFQSATGTGNQAQALNHVRVKDTADAIDQRPNAVVSRQRFHWHQVEGGAQNWMLPSGSLYLYLTIDVPRQHLDDAANEVYAVENFCGGVIDDIVAIAGKDQTTDSVLPDSELAIERIEELVTSENNPEYWESEGRFWFAAYMIQWGNGR